MAIRLSEHRRTAHRRRQDCTAATNSVDNRKPRGDGDGPFRPRPVHSRAESRIWQRRNRDKGRYRPTSAIRTREGDGDASLCEAGGWGTPLLSGARVQRVHGFGSLFSGLLLTAAPLIRRGAVAWGSVRWRLERRLPGNVVAGKNVKKAAKRRATAAGRNLMQNLLKTPPPPGKQVNRIKRAAPNRRVTPIKLRQRTYVFS